MPDIPTTIMAKPQPKSANPAQDAPNYRANPEIDARIDTYIKENPKHWSYIQGMPRERLERALVLGEVRALERQQRVRDNLLQRVNQDPSLKQAYDRLVKDLPEEQRDTVIAQLARQQQRVVARARHNEPSQGVGV